MSLFTWISRSSPDTFLHTEATETEPLMYIYQEHIDWPAFFIQQYLEALLSSPLIVADTLAAVQYQRRLDVGETEEPYQIYESYDGFKDAVPMYLPRLQSFPETARLLVESGQEGWTSNFKGHLTQFLYRSLYCATQPTLEEAMNDFFDVYEDRNGFTLVLSHVVTGTVLAPLEMARTRLIIQSSSRLRKKYYGAFHALYLIYQEHPNSSFLSTFYPLQLVLPSAFVSSLSPLIRYWSVVFIESQLGLDDTFTPLLYKASQIGMLAVEAFVMTPFELARNRLFAQQPKAILPPLDSCVELSDEYYSNAASCLKAVVKNEGGQPGRPTLAKSISNEEWQKIYGGGGTQKVKATGLLGSLTGFGNGVCSLFRGFWPRYLVLLLRFAAEEINKELD